MSVDIGGIVSSVFSFLTFLCSKNDMFICAKKDEDVDELDGNINFHYSDRKYILEKYIPNLRIDECGKFKIDIDGLFIYLNLRLKNIIGLKRKDLFYRPFYSANCYEEDLSQLYKKWKKALTEDIPIIVKHRHITKIGLVVSYCITEAYPVINEFNHSKGMKGITAVVSKKFFNDFDENKAMFDLYNSDIPLISYPININT